MSLRIATEPAWLVHVASSDVTCVRLACAARDDADPWPLSRALSALLSLGALRGDRPHALGGGRGIPVLHTQALLLGECAVELQAHHHGGGALEEVAITVPPWDELTQLISTEAAWWQLCDTVAAACDALYGALGDGEPLGMSPPQHRRGWQAMLRRHAGLLVREEEADAIAGADAALYRTLPQSGLAVLLR